jgi:hypothetical protein
MNLYSRYIWCWGYATLWFQVNKSCQYDYYTQCEENAGVCFSEPSDDGVNITFGVEEISPHISSDLGSTQPLTEMNTTNLPRDKDQPARKADNLTAICEPIV